MFSQDEYPGKFCFSPVIDFTLEATAAIIQYIGGPCHAPTLQCNSTRIGTLQSLSVLLSIVLVDFIAQWIPLLQEHLHVRGSASIQSVLRWLDCSTSTAISAFHPPNFWLSSIGMGTPQFPSILVCLNWCYSISLCTPHPPCGTPLLVCVLLSWDRHTTLLIGTSHSRLPHFCFIQHSSITFYDLLFSTQHSPSWRVSFSGSCFPFSPELLRLPFQAHFTPLLSNMLFHLY